jgi:Cu(I)/Ag(I) efflux system membrane fusion protein
VGKGQPLFEVYSPELVSAQREYAIAAQGVDSLKDAGGEAQAGMRQARRFEPDAPEKLGHSEEQIKALAKSGETKRTLTFRSPVSRHRHREESPARHALHAGRSALSGRRPVGGVGDRRRVRAGHRPGESRRWATVKINAYPDKAFKGAITYVYPTLTAETRTIPVRVELANPGQLLKPGMFAQMEVSVAAKGAVVTVPISAVIDSGTRRIVLIQAGEGRFEPREVKLGARSDTYVEVIEGVKDGEPVVVAANFLIDAESNLKAAVGGFRTCRTRRGALRKVRDQPSTLLSCGEAKQAAPAANGPATRRRQDRRHRRQGRDGIHCPRPGGQPQVAGHDDGLHAGQFWH